MAVLTRAGPARTHAVSAPDVSEECGVFLGGGVRPWEGARAVAVHVGEAGVRGDPERSAGLLAQVAERASRDA